MILVINGDGIFYRFNLECGRLNINDAMKSLILHSSTIEHIGKGIRWIIDSDLNRMSWEDMILEDVHRKIMSDDHFDTCLMLDNRFFDMVRYGQRMNFAEGTCTGEFKFRIMPFSGCPIIDKTTISSRQIPRRLTFEYLPNYKDDPILWKENFRINMEILDCLDLIENEKENN